MNIKEEELNLMSLIQWRTSITSASMALILHKNSMTIDKNTEVEFCEKAGNVTGCGTDVSFSFLTCHDHHFFARSAFLVK